MSTIGVRLKELRGASSQAEMARGVNVKQQNWARWENDVVSPSAEMLATICRVHACSADWLLGLRDSATPRETKTNIRAGANSAVAVGANARATVSSGPPGDAPQCARCPYKKKWLKIEAMK